MSIVDMQNTFSIGVLGLADPGGGREQVVRVKRLSEGCNSARSPVNNTATVHDIIWSAARRGGEGMIDQITLNSFVPNSVYLYIYL